MSVSKNDTIVAQATPSGRSGISIIRLSGPRSLDLVRMLVLDQNWVPTHKHLELKPLYEPTSNQLIDKALVTYFKAPYSFTGEDVIEINCHGSPLLVNKILESLLALNARAADAGEFTLRALTNGRLDLVQAEAIRDLIDAQTNAAVKQAARQLGGELSARLTPFKDDLISIIVPLESSLEFVEDDLPDDINDKMLANLEELYSKITVMAETFRSGRLMKDGLKVALVGRPNVGKSSVFNGLLLNDRAIVTSIPGTTRDTLSEMLSLEGVPVLLTDTAGIHESGDEVERLGIERTTRAFKEADLVVVVLDGTGPLTTEDLEVLTMVNSSHTVIAFNKNDLPSFSLSFLPDDFGHKVISISAKEGRGFEQLRDAIIYPFKNKIDFESDFLITNSRHYDLLMRTGKSLSSSLVLLEQKSSEELVLVGLYDALRYLGQITGETTAEDVLTEIFSTFCIGK